MNSDPKKDDGDLRVPGEPDGFPMGGDDQGNIIVMTKEEARARAKEIAAEEADDDE